MRPPKHVDRDGKLDLLRPAGAVVVVQHQGVVLIRTWFARAGGHVTLKDRRGRAKNKERTGSGDRKREDEEVRGRFQGHKELSHTRKDRIVLKTEHSECQRSEIDMVYMRVFMCGRGLRAIQRQWQQGYI